MATTTTQPLSPQNVPSATTSHIVPKSTSPPTEQEDYNTQIDALLTRYLFLLNEYTTLRSTLSSLQAGMYQNLARANFAAERGMRYGKEYFDERMVASRRVRISSRTARGEETGEEGKGQEEGKREEKVEGEKVMEWRIVKVDFDEKGNQVVKEKEKEKEKATQQEGNQPSEQDQDHDSRTTTNPETARHQKEDNSPEKSDDKPDDDDKKTKIKKIRNDPLRWFGLLTPLPLRQAQSQAIQAVEQIIPRLVTVNAEMVQVEIEVRRARKRREKAAGVKAKAVTAAEGVVGASA
ncbi:hypothetical protein SMACR_02217 [Sordaria macrospora]|uniref:Vacuolar ATPase assembly protein VMA22 n=2 Tax=Sordaria macrospora TaxID=5147 RepID=F7W2Z3_SORMK|nr:uncharacterized protein SMAC_02217 [Sordaria macrospora k-hell]KAA8632094.1 hypothetical protein SMACR_02217 [Sordaria macrospora]WPJ63684.1 hypothetical protein SMAC4_02217 [Sordaria macrospora]CCC11995.1 unnamed protein product [Sordaria macrospora k-hell]